jgi:hypothetical protein
MTSKLDTAGRNFAARVEEMAQDQRRASQARRMAHRLTRCPDDARCYKRIARLLLAQARSSRTFAQLCGWRIPG